MRQERNSQKQDKKFGDDHREGRTISSTSRKGLVWLLPEDRSKMVFTTTSENRRKVSNEEKIRPRRKANPPTIEDDFTIDLDPEEEEPFDEPRSTPTAKERKIIADKSSKNSVDSEIDMLCWTKSDLDGESRKSSGDYRRVEDKSKSMHSLVWSASELDDEESADSNPFNKVDERDDVAETRNSTEFREGSTNRRDNNSRSKASVQFRIEKDGKHMGTKESLKQGQAQPAYQNVRGVATKKHEGNIAIRTDNGIADDESNIFDDVSAFAVTPSRTPSVAPSVTKRTRNTKSPFMKSPRNRTKPLPMKVDDTGSAIGETSLLTVDIAEGAGGGCSMRKQNKFRGQEATMNNQLKKGEEEEEEDILDRFFENVESRVCKTKKTRKEKKKTDGLKRLINPFFDRLEQFDCIFEQLEEMACPKEGKTKDGSSKAGPSTPAAFAAEKFTQLLDQIEKFDPGFEKSKTTSCRESCDMYGQNGGGEEGYNSEDENTSHLSVHDNKELPSDSLYADSLDKAYERAEKMVKEQKRTSFEKKDQLQNMKEQWYAVRRNWQLRQSILTEAVKLNTAKAAESTTKCVENIVSSCHPSVSSVTTEKIWKDEMSRKAQNESQISGKKHDFDYESGAYHDVGSIGDKGFFSVMSPSEHSNIQSNHGGLRSILRNAESSGQVLSDGYSDEVMKDVDVDIGVSVGPLAVISEGVAGAESVTSERASKRKDRKEIDEDRSPEMPSNPIEWFEKLKSTVGSVSEKILDRAQCTSASINFTESNLFDDDHEVNNVVAQKNPSRDSKRSSASQRLKKENSIVEDENCGVSVVPEDCSVSVMPEAEIDNDNDDDLSGFETAVNTMDFEQDERPPMLRLIKSRTDSRSCGSREGSREGNVNGVLSNNSFSNSGSVPSRLSSEVPAGYTLADSIRYASLSAQNNGANRTRASKEPRGNKVANDPSSHVRDGSLPLPPPTQPKLDPECKLKDQERIRSPRSSETNETSDLTAVSASSSDVMVTQIADSTHSKRSMVVEVESNTLDDGKMTKTLGEISIVNFAPNTTQPMVDDDDDKGTVYTYNTTSSGSTEFRDCYQDAIPSMSTMGTALEDDGIALSAQKTVQKEIVSENIYETSFLPSNESIVKSMALLSVSATVLKTAGFDRIEECLEEYEVESVPSASTYPHEDIAEDSIAEERNEPLLEESLTKLESNDILQTLDDNEGNVEDSIVEKENESESLEKGESNEAHNDGNEESCIEEESAEAFHGNSEADSGIDMSEGICPKADVGDFPILKKSLFESLNQRDSREVLSTLGESDSIEDRRPEKDFRKHVEQTQEDEASDADELILESLKHQESVNNQGKPRLQSFQLEDFLEEQPSIDQPNFSNQESLDEDLQLVTETRKQRYLREDPISTDPSTLENNLSTLTTRKVSSKLREPRTLEDRRRRRLRQRRKFEKVLRGEDDTSTMSSSTMASGNSRSQSQRESRSAETMHEHVPLISASFDTGFGSVPVIDESQTTN